MEPLPKISDTEWQVLEVLWDHSPRSFGDIAEILRAQNGWETTKVYTLISRLIQKGAVAVVEGVTPKTCIPVVAAHEIRRRESQTFLDKVFGGSLNLMVKNLLEDSALSEADVAELKALLEKKSQENP